MNNKCTELIADNIRAIDIYPNCDLGISLPPSIPMITQVLASFRRPPYFSIRYVSDSSEPKILVELEESAKISFKPSQATANSGVIFTHEVQVTGLSGINDNILSSQLAAEALKDVDFSIILRYADGSRRLLYCFPHGSAIEPINAGANDGTTATVKIIGKSYSNMIEVVEK